MAGSVSGVRADRPTTQFLRTADVARILGVPPARVRRIVHADLCRPARQGQRLVFSFQDLVLLRAAHGLLLAEVPARRVRHALSELSRQLPRGRPLSGVRIYADGRHVVACAGGRAWRPENGQLVFRFDVDDLARRAGIVVPVHGRRGATAGQIRQPPGHQQSLAKRLQGAAAWFERALALERKKDIAGAIAAYHRAIELDPDMGDAYINLGRLVHEQGDAAEAARLYHLALSCSPDDPVAHYNLALALEDQQRPAVALSHYRRAISLDPAFADAHFNLGRLLERLGHKAQAVRHLMTYKKLTRE